MNGRGPGLRAVGLSLLIHLVVAAPVVVFARSPEPIEFETIRINLVSPPPAQAEEPQPAPAQAAPQPDPEPPTPEPEPEARVEEQPPPKPPERREQPERTERPPPAQQQTTPSRTEPDEEATTGGEGLNIRTEGREFPYPEYLENVIIQVNRYFRWTGDSRPKAVVYFEITQDGSVRNIRVVRPSGNVRFDFAVQGAVETAGTRGAFGPLPEGYAAPTLPVQLEVEPPR